MPRIRRLHQAVRIIVVSWLSLAAPLLAEGTSPHQPPMPKEAGAARSWEEKYAERKAHWCFQPVADIKPPTVRDNGWIKNDIDRFVLAKLEAAGLRPAPRASDAVLERRLGFALTGLPTGDAGVEKLLASPHFGEHWARHWMDVVRYAETYGSEHDYLNPFAWRYRDYLVRAFNTDLPYDRFIHEQLAGDLLPAPRIVVDVNESLLATAFQRMTEFYAVPVDVRREEATVIEWQIETFSKAFLGQTLACARCHDHKFDPLSAADYYALHGLFAGARPVMNIIDDPRLLTLHDDALARTKRRIRDDIAQRWSGVKISDEAWRKAIDSAKNGTPLAQLREKAGPRPAVEFSQLHGWRHSGPGLPETPLPAGSLSFHASGGKILHAIHPAGFFSDAITDRHGGSFRSPEFTLTKRNVRVLAGGTGKARLRLVVEGCQGDILLFDPANENLESAAPRWITLRLRDQWIGLRGHIEAMTRADIPTVGTVRDVPKWVAEDRRSSFGVLGYILQDDNESPPMLTLPAELWEPGSINRVTQAAITAWKRDELSDEQARLLTALLEAGLLPNQADAHLVKSFRDLEARIPEARRVAGVQDDGSGRDVPVYIRGDHLTTGEIVPRRMPDVLGGRKLADRLALAQELTRRDNPLVARVMVNRVWHHLFGRGIVGTPDNLGRTGDRPSHPELLDHLATRFMQDGWSVKRLIRYIVSSAAWQTSCEPPAEAARLDPDNHLLSHSRSRRLGAESIRDAMLAVAGNLDRAIGGPGVLNHYREVIDEDKQPPRGPVDGAGRRGIYLEVRRNFLSDLLTTFDFPRPNLVTGSRSVTNVPSQSITLLNDPFVHHQARVWAGRIAALPGDDAARIERMHREAFHRAPASGEVERALAFLRGGASLEELAHALFNMKEFIHLP